MCRRQALSADRPARRIAGVVRRVRVPDEEDAAGEFWTVPTHDDVQGHGGPCDGDGQLR